jgi:hypothetical protein
VAELINSITLETKVMGSNTGADKYFNFGIYFEFSSVDWAIGFNICFIRDQFRSGHLGEYVEVYLHIILSEKVLHFANL